MFSFKLLVRCINILSFNKIFQIPLQWRFPVSHFIFSIFCISNVLSIISCKWGHGLREDINWHVAEQIKRFLDNLIKKEIASLARDIMIDSYSVLLLLLEHTRLKYLCNSFSIERIVATQDLCLSVLGIVWYPKEGFSPFTFETSLT